MTAPPKLRPGMDEDKYRRDVREKCREIFGKLRDRLGKSDDAESDEESGEP